MVMNRPCLSCGTPTPGTYCDECRPPDTRPAHATRAESGYDSAWDRLSARARRLQPFCLDCGTTEDLTADHLPIAWERKAAGLAVRLADIEVVCRSCNTKRGAARGDSSRPRGETPPSVGVRGTASSRKHQYTRPKVECFGGES